VRSDLTRLVGSVIDMCVHHYLCHVVMHIGLDNFLKSKRVTIAKITT
jgi:hypothetical protein